MSTNDGGPAFPHQRPTMNQHGMSLRDWFAGQALPALIATQAIDSTIPELVWDAYKYADAMLKERERGRGGI